MAGNIKGITIEIGGNTSKLQNALKDVNKTSRTLNTELKQIENSLKFNPGNTELLAQKQRVLAESVENTSKKLEILKEAQMQAAEQLNKGDIGQDEYDALTREILKTENQLEKFTSQLASTEAELESLGKAASRLETYFEATGKTVDDFADVLGDDLVKAIKDGSASAKDYETALDKIGASFTKNEQEAKEFKKALDKVDSDGSLDEIREDLKKLEASFDDVEEGAKDVGATMDKVFRMDSVREASNDLISAFKDAGSKIKGLLEEALDFSTVDTMIEVRLDLDEESTEVVKESIRTVQAYGHDAEEALEGVTLQWQLNADASDEANQRIVEGAGAVARAYKGVDFTELIREVNEIASELEITDEQALALVNSLLKAGFPPGEIDIIAEYGQQLTRAGYSAEEIQAVFSAGLETGTWNIDNLVDGIKEGRVKMAEFGAEVPKAMEELLSKTDISAEQFQAWGRAVAEGGEGGRQALQDVTAWLGTVEDATVRNELGVQIFGTMWEDQGENISETLLNMDNHLQSVDQTQQGLNSTVESMNADPAVRFEQAMQDLKGAIAPLAEKFAELATVVANFVSENPELVAIVMGLVGAITTLLPIITAASSLFTALSVGGTLVGAGFGAIIGPAAAIVGAIVAVIGIGVALYKNWDTIQAKASEIWGGITSFLSGVWEGVKEAWSVFWDGVGTWLSEKWNGLKETAGTAFEGVKEKISGAWESVKTDAGSAWSGIMSKLGIDWDQVKKDAGDKFGQTAQAVGKSWSEVRSTTDSDWGAIKKILGDSFSSVQNDAKTQFDAAKKTIGDTWEQVKSNTSATWSGIKSDLDTAISNVKTSMAGKLEEIKTGIGQSWENIKSATTNSWNAIKTGIDSIVTGIQTGIKSKVDGIKNGLTSAWNSIKSTSTTVWNAVKSAIEGPINRARDAVSNAIGKMKSLLSVTLPFPKIKLPHFKISGKFSLNPPSIPKFSVSWYKEGGIFKSPSVIGVGEAGAEAVIPTHKLDKFLEDAVVRVTNKMDGGPDRGVNIVIQNMTVREDADIEKIAKALYKLSVRSKRGGVVYV